MDASRVAIPTVCFVPRGAAARNPRRYEPTGEEIEEDRALVKAEVARQKLQTAAEKAKAKAKAVANELGPEFNMDNYDDSDEEDDKRHFLSTIHEDMNAMANDPNLRDDVDSESEVEDEVLPTDLLLVAGTADRDWSSLEVYLWDETEGAFYVHHEVQTGAYPLAMEWLNTCQSNDPAVSRNLMAVGSFDSAIEIWDLDVLETPEPIMTLGVSQETHKLLKSKNQKKKAAAREAIAKSSGSHTAAVLSLHRNPLHANVLASGSADHTVRVWDVQQGTCQHTYTHHSDKVQAVRWAPAALSPAVLASGSYDRTLKIIDVRAPEVVATYKLAADAEAIAWNPHSPSQVVVASEDGKLTCLDIKLGSEGLDVSAPLKPVWSLSNGKSCSAVAAAPGVNGLWVTSSMDGKMRVYHQSDAVSQPKSIFEKDLKAGPLFTVRACEDEAATFGFGGEQVALMDLSGVEEVSKALPGGVAAFGEDAVQRLRAAQAKAAAAQKKREAKKAYLEKKLGGAADAGEEEDWSSDEDDLVPVGGDDSDDDME